MTTNALFRSLPVFICLVFLGRIPAEEQADLLDWQPPTRLPGLLSKLDDGTYAKRAQLLLDMVKPAHPELPVVGTGIEFIVPGGQSEALGLRVGDLLVRFNQCPIIGATNFDAARDKSAEKQLAWFSPTSGAHLDRLHPGKVGIFNAPSPVWHPLVYYRAKATSPSPWDRDLSIAAAAMQSDPELCFSALTRAVAAGCDDLVIPAMAAAASIQRLDAPLALRFASFACERCKAGDALEAVVVPLAFQAARMEGRIAYALRLALAHPELMPHARLGNWLRTEIGIVRRFPAQMVSPIAEADQRDFDLVDRFIADESRAMKEMLRHIRERGVFALEEARDDAGNPVEGAQYQFGPSAQDVDFSASFAIERDAHEGDHFLEFALRSDSEPDGQHPVVCRIHDNGSIAISVRGHLHAVLWRDKKPTKGALHAIRMAVVNGRCEVVLDGHRILLAQLDAPIAFRTRLFPRIWACRIKGTIEDLSWKTIHPVAADPANVAELPVAAFPVPAADGQDPVVKAQDIIGEWATNLNETYRRSVMENPSLHNWAWETEDDVSDKITYRITESTITGIGWDGSYVLDYLVKSVSDRTVSVECTIRSSGDKFMCDYVIEENGQMTRIASHDAHREVLFRPKTEKHQPE